MLTLAAAGAVAKQVTAAAFKQKMRRFKSCPPYLRRSLMRKQVRSLVSSGR
jgi:hypothetical protein